MTKHCSHEWSYASVVGYFRCSRCERRVDFNEPEYRDLLRDYRSAALDHAAALHTNGGQ